MTTIACNLEKMVSDRFVTYAPSYNGSSKIWTAKGSIWGAAGDTGNCLQFRKFTEGKGKRPVVTREDDDPEASRFEALQLSAQGMFLWVNDGPPDAVKEPFYAIGSGAGYAIGALTMQSTLEQAIEVAAKWDSNTRLPMDVIELRAPIPPRRKR